MFASVPVQNSSVDIAFVGRSEVARGCSGKEIDIRFGRENGHKEVASRAHSGRITTTLRVSKMR